MTVVCSPIATDQSKRKAARPSYSVLDCTKLRTDTNILMRSWQDAADEYLKRFKSSVHP
jgi:dTDP-4-dehydrorhamnose reductase